MRDLRLSHPHRKMVAFGRQKRWWTLGLWFLSSTAVAAENIIVYAAASSTHAVREIAALFQQKKNVKVKASFASSSTLARQIKAGAPAQVYLSAHPQRMDYLQQQGLLAPGTRHNLVGNRLVIIASKGQGFPIRMHSGFEFAKAFLGKLCMGNPSHVPAGIYGKKALISLGWWQPLASRIVGTKDVRAALALVERGECAAGIVYATDARISDKVEVLATFPKSRHPPIIYPVALIKEAKMTARAFLRFLQTSLAERIFIKYGFITRIK